MPSGSDSTLTPGLGSWQMNANVRMNETGRLDTEITGSNEQIAAHKSQIAALEERQKEFSGVSDELRTKRAEASQHIQESELKIMKFDAERERITVLTSAIEERARTLGSEVDMLRAAGGRYGYNPVAFRD